MRRKKLQNERRGWKWDRRVNCGEHMVWGVERDWEESQIRSFKRENVKSNV